MSTTHQHAPKLGAAIAIGAAALLLAGCAAPQSLAGDGGGDALTIAETTPPTSLDPQRSSMFSDRFVWQLSYECLLTTSDDGTVEPALATGYEKAEDGLSYTFTLRDGVTFSNGDTLDADDVVFTFDRLTTSPERIDQELFPTLVGAEKVDEQTVRFTLSSPDAGFVNNMANPLVWGCAILSDQSDDGLATAMIGTGPWTQSAYEPGTSLSLQRNDDYWGDPTASEQLSILYMPSMATQVSNLKAGKVDLIFPDQTSAGSLEKEGFSVESTPTDSTIFLQINDTKAPFDNPAVRQALALAFDRDQLAEQAYGGAARASGYLPPGLEWAPAPAELPNYTQDAAKSKELLAGAGFPDGVSAKLMYIGAYDYGTNDLLASMQDQLAQAGFQIELEPLEGATWGDRLTSLDYDLSWNAQSYYSNPYQYIAPAPGRQGPVPDSLQQLLDAALAADSQEAYQEALIAVEKHEAEIVYPTLTLLATDAFVAHPEGVTGVSVPSSQSRAFLAGVSKSAD